MTDRTDTLPEPAAWCSLTASGRIAQFDGRPMVMLGPAGNEHHQTGLHSADTVRRLLAEAVAAEREACAALCATFKANALLINPRSEVYLAYADAGHDLARAIRARKDHHG